LIGTATGNFGVIIIVTMGVVASINEASSKMVSDFKGDGAFGSPKGGEKYPSHKSAAAVLFFLALDGCTLLTEVLVLDNTTLLTEVLVLDNFTLLTEVLALDNSTFLTELLALDNSTWLTEVLALDNSTLLTELLALDNSTWLTEVLALDNSTLLTDDLTAGVQGTPTVEFCIPGGGAKSFFKAATKTAWADFTDPSAGPDWFPLHLSVWQQWNA